MNGMKLSFTFFVLALLIILPNIDKAERLNSYQEGDLNLGGMFPIHSKSCSCVTSSAKDISDPDCHQIYSKGLFLAEAMIYAVQLVNERGILPLNISLGYHILDTCNTLSMAVKNALVFVSLRKKTSQQRADDLKQGMGKQQDPFSLDRSNPGSNPSIIAVIGAGNSELSLAVSNILSLFNIPQVAYASSSAVFSDKTRYKTFLRVLPPDTLQAKAIAQLLVHFKWKYISLVSSDDHYAGPLREALHQEAQRLGICFANDIVFSYLPSVSVIQQALLRLKQTEKSRVILLFASERSAEVILRAADSLNLTDRIWIASDSWSNANDLLNQHFSILKGSLGIMFGFTPVIEFVVHLRDRLKISVESINKDPWLRSLSTAVRDEELANLINDDIKFRVDSQQNPYDVTKLQSVFARVDYVMNSVFVLAHVIRDFCLGLNVNLNSTKAARKEKCLDSIYPQSLLPFLFNRTLRGFSKNITVNPNGDPPGSYEFLNLQQSEGKLHQPRNIKIGSYESLSKVLKLNDSTIDLGQGKGKVPKSSCSEVCLPGFYYVKSRADQAACCWECRVCPSGQTSNISMATTCVECDLDHVPNKKRTLCVYVPLKYLTRAHPWSIIISVCSLLCFSFSVFFVWVFIRHRHSPVVRASCFEISLALLLSIALGFLLPLLEMSKPSHHKCEASAFLFAVVFSVILSLTLAKINRTVLILKNRRTGGGTFHRKFLLSSPAHFVSVIILSGIQISICIIWFFLNPPKPTTSTTPSPNFVRYLHCTDHTNLWFLVSSGFLIILSLICTLLAFQSRNFPENYNHAKFISLAMFTFNVVWLTFMGAYYGNPQPGVHQPIFRCCAIIFSNLCLMLLIYGPKVYVIFFRPELNNARTFREMNLQHLLAGEDGAGRTFSLASVGTPGHGNVYLMSDCDPNEKAVQTTRVLTYDVHTQTDEENYKRRHKSSLVSKLFHRGRGSRRKTGEITSPTHNRGWSESDAPKKHIKIGISHSQSSPILLYAHSKGKERTRTRQVKPLLDDFDGSDEIGLDRIEEVKDIESLAISSTVIRNNGTLQDSCDYESTSSHHYYVSSNDHEDEDKDDRDNDDDGSVTDITKDDVFVMDDCTQSAA